jgi:hypothetical protein
MQTLGAGLVLIFLAIGLVAVVALPVRAHIRRADAAYRKLVYRLDRLAHEARVVDPNNPLATQITDEIETFRTQLDP